MLHLLDHSGGDHQQQISSGSLPFIAVVVREAAWQSAVELPGDAGWQWFPSCKVLPDARWQRRSGIPVVAAVIENDTYIADIDLRTALPTAAAATLVLCIMLVAFAVA